MLDVVPRPPDEGRNSAPPPESLIDEMARWNRDRLTWDERKQLARDARRSERQLHAQFAALLGRRHLRHAAPRVAYRARQRCRAPRRRSVATASRPSSTGDPEPDGRRRPRSHRRTGGAN
jgi:hypothetical protein